MIEIPLIRYVGVQISARASTEMNWIDYLACDGLKFYWSSIHVPNTSQNPDAVSIQSRAPITIVTAPKGNALGWRVGGINKAEFL
ncbi:MAG: hypothetical protein MK006_14275 [Pirellulales bacterium]|nr:hypothetical protein [Pirellulales bacterium]